MLNLCLGLRILAVILLVNVSAVVLFSLFGLGPSTLFISSGNYSLIEQLPESNGIIATSYNDAIVSDNHEAQDISKSYRRLESVSSSKPNIFNESKYPREQVSLLLLFLRCVV